nr:hypothetical protein [Chitinophagaceae bacterium]
MVKRFLSILISVTLLLLLAEYFIATKGTLLTANIVMIGTLVLCGITLFTFFLSYRTAQSTKPHRFVNGVMGATFLKFFLCAAAAAVYIFMERKNVHKPDLFFLMFLYVVYTTIETIFLSSISKQNVTKP